MLIFRGLQEYQRSPNEHEAVLLDAMIGVNKAVTHCKYVIKPMKRYLNTNDYPKF